MNFRVVQQKTPPGAHSPYQVVEQTTGRGIAWINRYLDREYVRRLANKSLYSYAHSLLHFVRWWESVHHTGDIFEADLADSTLLDYIRFQSSKQPPPSASTINDRVACADRAIRNEFPDAPCQAAPGFHQVYLHRRPLGLGRPRFDLSRLRIREWYWYEPWLIQVRQYCAKNEQIYKIPTSEPQAPSTATKLG